MHTKIDQPFIGIEDEVLVLTKAERKALARASRILEQARELVGPDTDLGMDMGKGEVVCHEYAEPEGIVFASRNAAVDPAALLGGIR